jgi:translation initiation factor IF-2
MSAKQANKKPTASPSSAIVPMPEQQYFNVFANGEMDAPAAEKVRTNGGLSSKAFYSKKTKLQTSVALTVKSRKDLAVALNKTEDSPEVTKAIREGAADLHTVAVSDITHSIGKLGYHAKSYRRSADGKKTFVIVPQGDKKGHTLSDVLALAAVLPVDQQKQAAKAMLDMAKNAKAPVIDVQAEAQAAPATA